MGEKLKERKKENILHWEFDKRRQLANVNYSKYDGVLTSLSASAHFWRIVIYTPGIYSNILYKIVHDIQTGFCLWST